MYDEGDRNLAVGTIVWLTTEADDQSSFHCVIVSTDVMSDHIGRRRVDLIIYRPTVYTL